MKDDLDAAIYSAIRELWDEQGYAPTIREVMRHVGTHSHRSVHISLARLRDAGCVTWEDNLGRTLRLVKK